MTARQLTARVLLAIAALALVWAGWLVLFGGFDLHLFGHRIRTHEPFRPLAIAALALAIFVPLYGAERALHWWWLLTRRLEDGPVAFGLSVFVLVVGLAYSSTVGGGSDSYGYVSQSQLWLKGTLRVSQPWATAAPWPNQGWTFSPLGYRPADDRTQTELVPTYSPGLPLLMAAATLVGGHGAAFWIVPLAGAVLVFLTYGIGRRLGSPRAGLIGAWLVATSPVFLFMLMQPMTDVPVAAAWTAAFFFLLDDSSRRSAAAAGLASALAILIRPNLAPLALALGSWYVLRRRTGSLLLYAAGTAIGVGATAAINARLYGSPFTSGYGALSTLFGPANVLPNLRGYTSWLIEMQTPLILVGVAALVVPLRRIWPGVRDRRIFLVSGLFLLVLWAEYCAYLRFDDWTYLRFLLPSWPLLMVGMGGVALSLARKASSGRVLAVAGLVICLGLFEYRLAATRGVFNLWRDERASVLVARRVHEMTEPNAVILTMFHSGSVRYYGGRMTMRFDVLDPEWLDRSVAWLNQHGAHPYLLVNDWEIPQFVSRFSSQLTTGLLRTPLFIYQRSGVFLFDLAPRATPAGEPIVVTDINEDLRSAPPVPEPQVAWQ